MASPESTVFVLVPGAHCPGSYYHRVSERLRAKGYEAIEINNPSCGHPEKPVGMLEDAANIRSIAGSLMDKGKNVVVVANSYGGFIAAEAMKGLSESDREAAGKTGGRLVNLVFIGSLLTPEGITCGELIANVVQTPEVIAPVEGDFRDPPPPEGGVMVMSQLPPDECLAYAKQMKCQSTLSMNQKLTYEGWAHVPTTSVVTEDDHAVPPVKQHESIDRAAAEGKGQVRKISLHSDHIAMLSHPDEIVKILLEAAGIPV